MDMDKIAEQVAEEEAELLRLRAFYNEVGAAIANEGPHTIEHLLATARLGKETTVIGRSRLAQLHKAESDIARLPRTADGFPVICDGMTIFCPNGHEHKLTIPTGRLYCCKGECWSDGCQGDSGSGTGYSFDKCNHRMEGPKV